MSFEASEEAVARSHSTHAKSVEVFLENSIMLPIDASEAAKKAELQSESYALIRSLLDLARQHCEDVGLVPGSGAALAAFEEAHATATSITCSYEGLPFSTEQRKALLPDQVKKKLALRVPSHVTSLALYVQENGKLGAAPDWLSQAVGAYVRGRFKSPLVDRVLAQSLTQVEMVAYMDDVLRKDVLTGMSRLDEARPPSAAKAVWNVSRLLFVLWLVSVGIAASPLAFSALPVNAMLFAGLGLGTLGTITLVAALIYGVIAIAREKPKKKKQQNSILEMIGRMEDFFFEFKSDGPFSAARFRKRVNDLADAGVVWPSALFVLLDDMESRDVRSF